MSDRRYSVKNIGGGSYHIRHKDKVIATVERVHHYPEFYTNFLGKRVENKGKKFNTRFVVTDLPGASTDKFRTLKGAAQHAAFHHLNNEKVASEHPIKLVGLHIEHLGKAIHATAADHRMTQQDQENLLQISKAHAAVRQLYNKHFEQEP